MSRKPKLVEMKCACRKAEPEGYLQWHAWAEEQDKKGHKQEQCKLCGLWYFKGTVDE